MNRRSIKLILEIILVATAEASCKVEKLDKLTSVLRYVVTCDLLSGVILTLYTQ